MVCLSKAEFYKSAEEGNLEKSVSSSDSLMRPLSALAEQTLGKSIVIRNMTGATFNQIPYDSDASAKTAVMSGECDFTVCKVQSGIEDYKAGDLKFLCLLATEPVSIMSEVPLVTAEYSDFSKYLPWGPFYGVFVKKGTDSAIIETLSKAFSEAGPQQSDQDVLANFNINFLGCTGNEAANYISAWRENTLNALKNSGAIS